MKNRKLLSPSNDPKLPILRLISSGLQTRYVAPCKSLRDGETNKLLPTHDLRNYPSFKLVGPEIEYGWKTDDCS